MIESPCNLVCTLDGATGWCLGCGRSGDEIADWSRTGDDARRAIVAQLPDRMRRLNSPSRS